MTRDFIDSAQYQLAIIISHQLMHDETVVHDHVVHAGEMNQLF